MSVRGWCQGVMFQITKTNLHYCRSQVIMSRRYIPIDVCVQATAWSSAATKGLLHFYDMVKVLLCVCRELYEVRIWYHRVFLSGYIIVRTRTIHHYWVGRGHANYCLAVGFGWRREDSSASEQQPSLRSSVHTTARRILSNYIKQIHTRYLNTNIYI